MCHSRKNRAWMGGGAIAPKILQTKQLKSLKITTYKSGYSNIAKIGSYLMDIGNHIYTNVQNCILLKSKCVKNGGGGQNRFTPPPYIQHYPTALCVDHLL